MLLSSRARLGLSTPQHRPPAAARCDSKRYSSWVCKRGPLPAAAACAQVCSGFYESLDDEVAVNSDLRLVGRYKLTSAPGEVGVYTPDSHKVRVSAIGALHAGVYWMLGVGGIGRQAMAACVGQRADRLREGWALDLW